MDDVASTLCCLEYSCSKANRAGRYSECFCGHIRQSESKLVGEHVQTVCFQPRHPPAQPHCETPAGVGAFTAAVERSGTPRCQEQGKPQLAILSKFSVLFPRDERLEENDQQEMQLRRQQHTFLFPLALPTVRTRKPCKPPNRVLE